MPEIAVILESIQGFTQKLNVLRTETDADNTETTSLVTAVKSGHGLFMGLD